MEIELAIHQWREGEHRLDDALPEHRPAMHAVTGALIEELRRRLGGSFTSRELIALYEQGTDWCTDLAYSVAPGVPEAWDPRITADAAFGRYLRSARDYAGGRLLD